MRDETDADINLAAEGADAASPSGEDELDRYASNLLLVGIACACALVVVELLRWRLRRAGEKLARRHPLLVELTEELVNPPWRFR